MPTVLVCFGFDAPELLAHLEEGTFDAFENVRIRGLMGMATFTDDTERVRREFRSLKTLFDRLQEAWPGVDILSMGMSGDFETAIEEGATLVRVGTAIFGARE